MSGTILSVDNDQEKIEHVMKLSYSFIQNIKHFGLASVTVNKSLFAKHTASVILEATSLQNSP